MFERIKKKTGIHVTPKDLRDYFGTVVAGRTSDANTLMHLMRHTSLNTTTKYMRTLHDSMRDAVEKLGRILGGGFEAVAGHKTTQNDIERQIAAYVKPSQSLGILEGILVAVGRVELPTPRI